MSVVQACSPRTLGVGMGYTRPAPQQRRPDALQVHRQRGRATGEVGVWQCPGGAVANGHRAVPTEARTGVSEQSERFQVQALLGSGGVARVYRAFDTWTNRCVALKAPGHGGELEASVQREARLLAKLNHPNVLCSLGLVGHRDVTCLATEYCSGGSLAQWLRGGNPSIHALLRFVADACSALEYVHQQGLLHLDVKPHNLLVAADGCVRLGDFGSAVDRSENPGWRPVDESAIVTPYYMAPEQWAMAPVDERTDLWALGVILHEGYFGVCSVPLGLGVPVDFAARVHAFQRDGTPADFASLLAKLLSPDPTLRHQSAGELREAILACLAVAVRSEALALGERLGAVANETRQVNDPEGRIGELMGAQRNAEEQDYSAYAVVA